MPLPPGLPVECVYMRRYAVIFFLLIITGESSAQLRNLRFDHFTPDQGLSQNNVTSILQDRAGFMWFATRDGLNRFDGYRFNVYKRDPERSSRPREEDFLSIRVFLMDGDWKQRRFGMGDKSI